MKQILKKAWSSGKKIRFHKFNLPKRENIERDRLDLLFRFLFSMLLAGALLSMDRVLGVGQATILRIVLGIIFLGLLPGDAFLLVLFPGKKTLTYLERFVFMIIMSAVIIALTGYLLNYSLWGITFDTMLLATEIIITLCYAISFLQKRAVRRGKPEVNREETKPIETAQKEKPSKKIIVSLLASGAGLIALIFLISLSGPEEKYTEYFILDAQYQLGIERNNYTLGETLPLNLVVINHEGRTEIFHLFLIDNHNTIIRITSIQLENQQQWNQPFNLDLLEIGEDQIYQFVLYREGDIDPYRSLQIVISVYETE
jgi:uncharacterized membrane protein